MLAQWGHVRAPLVSQKGPFLSAEYMVEPNGRPFDAVAWSAEYTAVKQAWAEQGEPDRFDDMEGWWLSSPHEEPMILVEGADGKIHKWDGFHRIGISMTHGATHVPAVVGRRDHKGT